MRVVVLENIRSAYNVGNIIRTADALGWDVWLCGYTPNPLEYRKVVKTSLGAEKIVSIKQFDYTQDVIKYAKENDFEIIAAEINNQSIKLSEYSKTINVGQNLAVVF